ncbi:MAG: carboxypeptidase-like regulatory domain-containing protein [Ignavibacteria bacterium]|nr:carboxypeptidase-like regulatory domain-containing protein [Ignavibacteria bacterium]
MFIRLSVFILLMFVSGEVFTQQDPLNNNDKGVLKGKIIDNETEAPVEGAAVEILGSTVKTETDVNGNFSFINLNFDTYQIKITSAGYEPMVRSDLLLYASKPLEIIVKIKPKGYKTSVIDVEGNFFIQSSDVNLSSINLDYEEIRRALRLRKISPGCRRLRPVLR